MYFGWGGRCRSDGRNIIGFWTLCYCCCRIASISPLFHEAILTFFHALINVRNKFLFNSGHFRHSLIVVHFALTAYQGFSVPFPTCRNRVSRHRFLRSPAHIYNRFRAGCYHTPISAHRMVFDELFTSALSSADLESCGSGIWLSKNAINAKLLLYE